MDWENRIESSVEVLSGKPRVKGTRIPVSLILGYLASDRTHNEILQEYPDLDEEDIRACLEYARELSEFQTAI